MVHLGSLGVIVVGSFRESFSNTCSAWGLDISLYYHNIHKQMGLWNCYNGIIVARLHRMLVELPGVGWPEVLPDVLAGLYATLEIRVLTLPGCL